MKYTIVYAETFQVGSHRQSITHFDRIETDDLATLLKDPKYYGNVWFVFVGWPKLEGERD